VLGLLGSRLFGRRPVAAPAVGESAKFTAEAPEVRNVAAPTVGHVTHAPAETTVEVTYENNALGDDMESRTDKSDPTPDS